MIRHEDRRLDLEGMRHPLPLGMAPTLRRLPDGGHLVDAGDRDRHRFGCGTPHTVFEEQAMVVMLASPCPGEHKGVYVGRIVNTGRYWWAWGGR